jgi:hypothetical protein
VAALSRCAREAGAGMSWFAAASADTAMNECRGESGCTGGGGGGGGRGGGGVGRGGFEMDGGPQRPRVCSATDLVGACAATAVMRCGLGVWGAALMGKECSLGRKRDCIDSTLELCPGRSL